jgi:hypothetical protein
VSNKLDSIFRDHFCISLEDTSVHFEVISRNADEEKFLSIRKLYLDQLATHPLREQGSKKLYIDEEVIIHLLLIFPRSDVAEIKPDSFFYYPVCTIEEIKRIENPQAGDDYLLLLRANPIADNPRIARIFFARMENFGDDWSLTGYYEDLDFDFGKYITKLTEENALKCSSVPSGFILVREPNGACIKSKFGEVVVVSEAMRHFLYYMNVFAHHRNFSLDLDDAVACLFIAMRTMLQTEALDFDIDPRGDLPRDAHDYCRIVADDQLQFIIGHEYAHLILGHLDSNSMVSSAADILTMSATREFPKYYTPRQQQEFDADTEV